MFHVNIDVGNLIIHTRVHVIILDVEAILLTMYRFNSYKLVILL